MSADLVRIQRETGNLWEAVVRWRGSMCLLNVGVNKWDLVPPTFTRQMARLFDLGRDDWPPS